MDNTDTKSEDENYHISEDSGNCDQSTPPPLVGFLLKNKINKPKLSFLDKLTGEDCGGAGNGDVLENDGLFDNMIMVHRQFIIVMLNSACYDHI